MRDGGVDVDAVARTEQQQIVAILEFQFALEHHQEPLAVVIVGVAAVAIARDVEHDGVHRPISPLVGQMLDDDAGLAILDRRVGPAHATLDDDVLRGDRQPLDQRVDAALKHVGKFDQPIERRRQLAVFELGKPAHCEFGPGHDLFEGQAAGDASGTDTTAKISEVDGCRHMLRSE